MDWIGQKQYSLGRDGLLPLPGSLWEAGFVAAVQRWRFCVCMCLCICNACGTIYGIVFLKGKCLQTVIVSQSLSPSVLQSASSLGKVIKIIFNVANWLMHWEKCSPMFVRPIKKAFYKETFCEIIAVGQSDTSVWGLLLRNRGGTYVVMSYCVSQCLTEDSRWSLWCLCVWMLNA